MPQPVLSERSVARRTRAGGAHADASQREQALYHRVKETLGQEAANELEEVVTAWIMAEESRVLTYVGAILLHDQQAELWRRIYNVVTDTPSRAEHQRFLAEQMATVATGLADVNA